MEEQLRELVIRLGNLEDLLVDKLPQYQNAAYITYELFSESISLQFEFKHNSEIPFNVTFEDLDKFTNEEIVQKEVERLELAKKAKKEREKELLKEKMEETYQFYLKLKEKYEET